MLNRRKAAMDGRISENNARMVRLGRDNIEAGVPFDEIVEAVYEQTSLCREEVVRALSTPTTDGPVGGPSATDL